MDYKAIYRILVVVATIAIVAYLCPRKEIFDFTYKQGTKWQHESLVAPFDFPILKPDSEIKAEKDEIIENFKPRFLKNNNVAEEFLIYIDNLNFDSTTDIDEAQLKFNLKKLVGYIYGKGILSEEDFKTINGKDILIEDNIKTILRNNKEIFTPISANEYIIKELQKSSANINFTSEYFNFPPDCTYNKDLNDKLLNDRLENVSINSGMVKKNDIIIGKEDIVTNDKVRILESYHSAFSHQVSSSYSYFEAFIGYFILILLIIGVLVYYIANARKEVYNNNKSIFFLMMWILIFTYGVYILDPLGEKFVYAIPFIIAPIVMINFFDKKLALYHHIIIIFIASLVTRYSYEFVITQILVGMIAIQLFAELRFWNKFFRNILYVFFSYIFVYTSLSIVNHGNIGDINWTVIIAFIFNSLLILIAYPLIPLLERPFGYVSKITLTEFGDFNKPLLKELSYKAPGTFQHSIQVGIIAEAATEAIRGNALLVKIGALYHDIGKIYDPQFFVENQRPEDDPYKDLDNYASAIKIIEHVKIGKQIAVKNGLPKVLQRFIVTHHGTTKVEFFYRKQFKEFPENADDKPFRYPGPNPVTREECILMLADSLEATAKCLLKPTEKDINDLVENIVDQKINDHQLEDSVLSFRELIIVKKNLKKTLLNIHHSRIEYPVLDDNK